MRFSSWALRGNLHCQQWRKIVSWREPWNYLSFDKPLVSYHHQAFFLQTFIGLAVFLLERIGCSWLRVYFRFMYFLITVNSWARTPKILDNPVSGHLVLFVGSQCSGASGIPFTNLKYFALQVELPLQLYRQEQSSVTLDLKHDSANHKPSAGLWKTKTGYPQYIGMLGCKTLAYIVKTKRLVSS